MTDITFKPGCYFDSARGVYLIDALAEFAEHYGFNIGDDDPTNPLPESLSDYEFSGEIEDDIDDFFNSKFPLANHHWGRNDNGDWGLWLIEEED